MKEKNIHCCNMADWFRRWEDPQPGGSSHLRNQKCHQSAEYASQSSDFSAQKLTEESDAWLVFIQVLTPLGLVMHKMHFNDSFSPINC